MTSERAGADAVEPSGVPGEEAGRAGRPVLFTLGRQQFVKKGLSRFDPRDPYYFAVSLNWSRFFLLFVAAELAINTCFALLYMLQPASIANQQTPGFISAFFFSLETLATVGYGEMYPGTLYGHVISALEIMTGVIFMAIMTGLLFVRFSRPKAKILYAAHPVVTAHNGKPTLMLRIGNARSNLLYDARISLYFLSRTISAEGRSHADVVELPLLRNRIPVFAILWTMMHVVDDASPLAPALTNGENIDALRFFMTISARDPLIGQDVSDVHVFNGIDLRFGMRYVDAISPVSPTRVIADYALLGSLEPDVAAAPTSENGGST